jgi:hypothetical protein
MPYKRKKSVSHTFTDYFPIIPSKKAFSLMSLLFILLVLPVSIFLANQKTNIKQQAAGATTFANRIPFLGGNWFLLGYNYPWLHYSYDFGPNNGGNNIGDYATIDGQFADMHDNAGVRVTRWFVFNDFSQAPLVDSTTGMVTGLPANFFQNMDDALAIAKAHNIYLELELIDGTTLLATSNANATRNSKVVTDATVRQSYFDNAVKPILQRYAGNSQVIAWSTWNEPDYQTTDVACGTSFLCVPYADMQTFMSTFTAYVHTYAPGALATINNGPMHFTHYWTGLGFDFYSPHWYNWMNQYWPDTDPFTTTAASHNLDKPIVLSELPSATAQGYTVNIANMLDTLNANGYAGALFWSRNSGDSVDSVSSYAGTKATINSWTQVHSTEVNIQLTTSSPTPTFIPTSTPTLIISATPTFTPTPTGVPIPISSKKKRHSF